MQKGRIFRR